MLRPQSWLLMILQLTDVAVVRTLAQAVMLLAVVFQILALLDGLAWR